MTKHYNDIATQLQAYKQDTQQSQMEIAAELNISQPQLSQILKGRRGITDSLLKDMVKAGMVQKTIASLPDGIKDKVGRMAWEDQCLVEEFVNRLMR